MFAVIVKKIKRAYQEKGISGVLRRSLQRCTRVLFETNDAIWFNRDLNEDVLSVDSDIQLKVTINNFKETYDWISQMQTHWMLNANEFNTALQQGHFWANIKHENNIIGYIKLGYNNVYIVDYNMAIHFPPKVAFIYDTYVLPELRGHKVASYFINEVADYLKNDGYCTLMCHIPRWNIASIKSYERIGFKRMGKIRYLKIFGFSYLTANPLKMVA